MLPPRTAKRLGLQEEGAKMDMRHATAMVGVMAPTGLATAATVMVRAMPLGRVMAKWHPMAEGHEKVLGRTRGDRRHRRLHDHLLVRNHLAAHNHLLAHNRLVAHSHPLVHLQAFVSHQAVMSQLARWRGQADWSSRGDGTRTWETRLLEATSQPVQTTIGQFSGEWNLQRTRSSSTIGMTAMARSRGAGGLARRLAVKRFGPTTVDQTAQHCLQVAIG